MIHQPAYVKELFRKYLEGTATPAEIARLRAAWKIHEDEELLQMINDLLFQRDYSQDHDALDEWMPSASQVIEAVKRETSETRVNKLRRYFRIAGIFIVPVIAMMVMLLWIVYHYKTAETSCDGLTAGAEIPTSQYSFRLMTDSSGSRLVNGRFSGVLKQEGNLELFQAIPGILQYRKRTGIATGDDSIISHTISTPPNQQYQLILPGGTMVRLNASTSIQVLFYPSGECKQVEVDGEAYFEVAVKMPLNILTKHGRIEVSRGDFNLNANRAQSIAALQSGSLQVFNGADNLELSACGDLAVTGQDSIRLFRGQDMYYLLSWKKADRIYHKVHLQNFVTDMCRWYGLQFENLNCVPDKQIDARICYKAPVSEMLAILRRQGLRFQFEGENISFCDQKPVDMRTTAGLLNKVKSAF